MESFVGADGSVVTSQSLSAMVAGSNPIEADIILGVRKFFGDGSFG